MIASVAALSELPVHFPRDCQHVALDNPSAVSQKPDEAHGAQAVQGRHDTRGVALVP